MTETGQGFAFAALQRAKTRSSQHLKKQSEFLSVSSTWGMNRKLLSVSSKVFLCRPQRNLLGCAYSWWLGILGLTDWGCLSMFCAPFTAPRGTYTGNGLFQRWRGGCDAVLFALDFWTGNSLNAFKTSLQRKQIQVTIPSQGENLYAWEGEVTAQFGAFFPSLLAACPPACEKQGSRFCLLFCQHYYRYSCQRQKNRTSSFLCWNCSFFPA